MRTRSNGRPDPAGGPEVLAEPHEPAVDRLRRLAAEGRTGALQVLGRPGGVVHLVDGHVAYAESPATPGVEAAVLRAGRPPDEAAWAATVEALRTRTGRRAAASSAAELVAQGALPPVRLDAAVQSATAEALLAMLAGYGVTVTRTRFVDGTRPGSIALDRPLATTGALAETERRFRLLAAVGRRVRPDDEVGRAAAGPGAVRLTPPQWELVRLCPAGRTPRQLAWSTGRGVLATTLDVGGLIDLGVLGPAVARGGDGRSGRRADRDGGRPVLRTVSFLAAAVPGATRPEGVT